MSFLRSKRRLLAVIALVVVTLLVVRPGAGGLKNRIVRSLSQGLGRQVEIQSVSLRVLPWPGFELHNFVIHDDPFFSAEPMLRAQTVSASLRMISLFRGRFEISRLDFAEPSLNLARNSQGHWNLEDLLQHAAKTPSAPTSKNKTGGRIAFPYIQADRARINFKFGLEKKPYALTEADFSLWQDSENQWGMRLKAQPVRTDFNLTDTGVLKVSGNWQRAGSLRETPLEFKLEWSHAQLGQASKLAYGNDRGWRGGILLNTTLSGKPANLSLDTKFEVQDFRRFGVAAGAPMRLSGQCGGRYSSVDHSLTDISCRAPVGPGVLSLDGKMTSLLGPRSYDLRMTAQGLPIASLLVLARHCRQNIPDGLVAAGTLEGQATVAGRREKRAEWHGGGSTSNLRLGSKSNATEFVVGTVPFALAAASQLPDSGKRVVQSQVLERKTKLAPVAETRVDFGPFSVALGRPSPAHVRGSISRTSYGIAMQGGAEVQTLLQLAKMAGIAAPIAAASGSINFDLRLADNWGSGMQMHPVGQAQLRSVRAEVLGINKPLEIISANLLLKPDEIAVQNVAFSLANSTWRGFSSIPLHCADPGVCPARFDLHSLRVEAEQLNESFNPTFGKRPWYRFLASSRSRRSYLLGLNAKGKLTADRVIFKDQTATNVSAIIDWNRGKLRASQLRGTVFGGSHVGEWKADFTVQPPHYTGTGTLEQVDLERLANVPDSAWITGTASGKYQADFEGLNASQMMDSADAVLGLDISNGSLAHVELSAGSGPLEMQHFTGSLKFRDNKFVINDGRLDTQDATYQVSGTAALGGTFQAQALNVTLSRNGLPGFSITGTLNEPKVVPASASETRAALKP